MPHEIRHVLFNDREVCEMVFDLLASRGDRRPMTGARVEIGEAASGPSILLHYSDAGGRHTLKLATREALAAAILHCRSRRVPLPARADKRLEIVRGHLALVLSSRTGHAAERRDLPTATASG